MLNNNSRMDEVTPLEFYLSQNYPNPFKDKTTIKYCVSYKTHVNLTVLDAERNEIEKLVDEEKKPGTYEVEFKSAIGSRQLANGIYFYQLQVGSFIETKKMILLR